MIDSFPLLAGYYQVVEVGKNEVVVEGVDRFEVEEHEFTVK